MEDFIAQMLFVAHITQVMGVCEKNDLINVHSVAKIHNIDLGVSNGIVGEISRSGHEWSRVKIAPTKYGLRKAA